MLSLLSAFLQLLSCPLPLSLLYMPSPCPHYPFLLIGLGDLRSALLLKGFSVHMVSG